MTKKAMLSLLLAVCVILPEGASAAPQVPYPSRGQSTAQQQRDQSECNSWAIQQTGFNPSAPPPPQAVAQGATGSGARVKGAAAGAVIGGISGGDVGSAAVAGAVGGAVIKRSRNRREARAVNEANAQQAGAGRAAYDQARSACLSGRGYSLQ